MKKFLSYFLFILMIASLSACTSINGKQSEENEVGNSQEINKNNSVETDADEETTIKEEEQEDKSKEESQFKNSVEEKPVVNKKIVVIDPGHSSNGNKEMEEETPNSGKMKIKDPGGAQGISTNAPEYLVNMNVALKLKKLLEQNNITVIMTKTQDAESPGNIDRAKVGNDNNADLAIRIHCDSADSQSAKGASMLVPAPIGYAKNISGISEKYGQVILNDLVSIVGMNNRGVVERTDLTGFNWSKVPVVLVEMGFMSNVEEDRLLSDDNYENKLAQGLCNGILEALQVS